ncbi:MAG TPA: hypothetical protein VHF01_16175 [Candidatus Acidoferrum sp.]|nr:hypothetical protein [Candidatus Acidoferrum sp.]
MAKFQKFDPREHIRGLAEAARQILAEELVREQQMPLFDQVVEAVEETRREYGPRIIAARLKSAVSKRNRSV